MKYSDWQLNRIRDALRAYHRYERCHDGTYFIWKDVSEAIDEYTDVKVPHERLRQFVEGVNKKDGGRKLTVPHDRSMEGIVSFVLNEELNLLSPDELEEYAPERQAPMRLLEFLDRKFDKERFIPPAKLAGCYELRRREKDDKNDVFVVRELTLQRPLDNGLIQIIETQSAFEGEVEDAFDKFSPQDKKDRRKAYLRHGGWAILTPEDNLFCFLKNERNGMNRYYFTLATDLVHWSEEEPMKLVFLHHDDPLEIAGQEAISMDTVMSKTMQKIISFRRIT